MIAGTEVLFVVWSKIPLEWHRVAVIEGQCRILKDFISGPPENSIEEE